MKYFSIYLDTSVHEATKLKHRIKNIESKHNNLFVFGATAPIGPPQSRGF